jgi:hypothetical protein
MKRHFMSQKPTGKCFSCGRPTKLLVHQGCGVKGGKERKKMRLPAIPDGAIPKILGER